jgi:hypothetical protein
MKKVLLGIDRDNYSIETPYDESFVDEIKSIDRSFRKWEKPYWLINKNATHNSQPAIEYLRLICSRLAQRLNLPFRDGSIELTPAQQIRERVSAHLERFTKLINLCDRLEKNSLRIELETEGAAIFINQKIESDEYSIIRAIADKIESTQQFYFQLNDSEIIRLLTHPTISNASLIELTLLESFDHGTKTATSIDGKKYLCSRNSDLGAIGVHAIIDGALTKAHLVSNIVNFGKLIDTYSSDYQLKLILAFHLQDELIKTMRSPDLYTFETIRVNHKDR